jgi:hypothetical protein
LFFIFVSFFLSFLFWLMYFLSFYLRLIIFGIFKLFLSVCTFYFLVWLLYCLSFFELLFLINSLFVIFNRFPPWYNWNVVESGINTIKQTHQTFLSITLWQNECDIESLAYWKWISFNYCLYIKSFDISIMYTPIYQYILH